MNLFINLISFKIKQIRAYQLEFKPLFKFNFRHDLSTNSDMIKSRTFQFHTTEIFRSFSRLVVQQF